ncbi:MAG: alpha/beta fold hydrolase [Acidobacteria bacterium]|nr:alpha/beta fold hydrolase [Acidobacteriota bacterium]
MRELVSLGFRIVELAGARRADAVPVLLLHGFAGRAESWRAVAAATSAAGALFAVDLPGHGPVSPVDPRGGFAGALDALARALLALHRGPWHLAGYSMGARVALALAARAFPAATLTLVGAHPGLATTGERDERCREDGRWIRLLREQGIAAFVAAWEARPLFASQSALPAEALDEQRRLRSSHDPDRLAGALETLGLGAMPDCRPALPRIAVPVALVAGERDAKFLGIARSMLPQLARGQLFVAPGAGHNVPLERPSAVAALVNAAAGNGVR